MINKKNKVFTKRIFHRQRSKNALENFSLCRSLVEFVEKGLSPESRSSSFLPLCLCPLRESKIFRMSSLQSSHLTSAGWGDDRRGHVGHVGVLQGLPGGDPLVRVVGQELAEEVVAARGEIHWQDVSPVWRSLPVREDRLVVRQAGNTRPGLLGGSSQHSENPGEKIFLTSLAF